MEHRPKRPAEPAERRRGSDDHPIDESTLASWREVYRHTSPAGACPDDETLASLVLERSAPNERRDDALLEHVVRCPRCAQALRDLWELDGEARRLSRPRLRWSWRVAAAVALVFAGALAWLLFVPARVENGDRQLVRGATLGVLPADGANLTTRPTELSWPPQTGATSYRVELHEAAGETVWRSPDLEQTRLHLPAEVSDGLEPGSYYWIVEVEGAVANPRLGPFWWTLSTAPP